MVIVIVGCPVAAAAAVGVQRLIFPLTGLLSEAGVNLVVVLHLGVYVVGGDVGVGVLVDVGGAVGGLKETVGSSWSPHHNTCLRHPVRADLSDQSVAPASGRDKLRDLVVVVGYGEAGVDIVNGVVRIKHNTVIILDVASIMPSL